MDRGRDGRRSRKPGARACRCGQSNGSWASTGPPSGVIWRPEVLQDGSSGWCPIRRHRIPWQRNGVPFSLNTYPDIFPDLRQRLQRVGPLGHQKDWVPLSTRTGPVHQVVDFPNREPMSRVGTWPKAQTTALHRSGCRDGLHRPAFHGQHLGPTGAQCLAQSPDQQRKSGLVCADQIDGGMVSTQLFSS